jgi:hypothetical protein
MKRLEFIEHRFRSIYSEPRDDQMLSLEQHVTTEEHLEDEFMSTADKEERLDPTSLEGGIITGQDRMSVPVEIMNSQLSRIKEVLAMAMLSSEEKVARIAAIVDSNDH